MAEWLNAPVLKTGVRLRRTVGSNPTPTVSSQPAEIHLPGGYSSGWDENPPHGASKTRDTAHLALGESPGANYDPRRLRAGQVQRLVGLPTQPPRTAPLIPSIAYMLHEDPLALACQK